MMFQQVQTCQDREEVFNQINIGIWEWDLHSDKVTWSENMVQFMGLKSKNRKRKRKTTRKHCMASIHKDDIDFVTQKFNSCIEKEGELKIEYRVVWPDNTIHWVQSRGAVVYSREGTATYMQGVMFDITERKHMEETLNEAKELAAKQNQAKSDFLSRMSHELKTPLNAIIGFSQLISEDSNITKEQQQDLQYIKKAGEHVNSLVGEILDLATIEAGQVKLNIKPVLVKDLVTECVELINISAKQHQQRLSIDTGKCGDQYIHVDEKRITQVILNLLSNAVKYNKAEDEIRICCKQSGDKIRISVIDNGSGLTPEQQDNLFRPFHRLGAEKTAIPGTGLGLVITRQLVELMHGQVGVECLAGAGCTFWVSFPYQT
jgi:PAS domain S-box-containing protein